MAARMGRCGGGGVRVDQGVSGKQEDEGRRGWDKHLSG